MTRKKKKTGEKGKAFKYPTPTGPFTILDDTKSVDRRILCRTEKSIYGFWGFIIVKESVGFFFVGWNFVFPNDRWVFEHGLVGADGSFFFIADKAERGKLFSLENR